MAEAIRLSLAQASPSALRSEQDQAVSSRLGTQSFESIDSDELMAMLMALEDVPSGARAADHPTPASGLGSKKCPVCMEVKLAFEVQPCGHFSCLRCAVTHLKTALGNAREQVKAKGVKCLWPDCQHFITPDIARSLLRLSASLTPTGSFAPMDEGDVDKIDKFAVEASIPQSQKLYCPQCEKLTLLSGGEGETVTCPYCAKTWNRKQTTGEDAATVAAINAKASLARIVALA
eukprot:CAMPEP_0197629202 /NCGR_PEP_ID=MMETSP1338-20131121/7160_1 /TAXON_ID=43686 ORGANISM="Pelagodinium beii, Strain RCC1491" /NCGR_SAMPLE_ID=MMETSP1338 /ASSEMBLY_ACC=CAM_ASM_000754 /LENGTH=232 /DNA_ID=CAMNT_0043200225 /DNA_START=173 /DNA_END=872 /DNA_ORIENTATION=+